MVGKSGKLGIGFVLILIALLFFGIYFKEDIKEITSNSITGDYLGGNEDFELKESLENTFSKEEEPVIAKKDELIESCLDEYNYYKDISESKYGWKISLIKYQKFENKEKAEKFYDDWKNPLIGLAYPPDHFKEEAPLVIFATNIKNQNGQIPAALVCNNDGELTDYSKFQLQLR